MADKGFDVITFTSSVFRFLASAIAETVYSGAQDEAALKYVEDNYAHVVKMIKEANVKLSQFAHPDVNLKEAAQKLVLTVNNDENGIDTIRDVYFKELERFKDYDFLNMEERKLSWYGFERWEEDRPLVLIPIWAYDLIPDGTELYSVNEKKVVKGEGDISMAPRFGRLAWGFLREPENTTIEGIGDKS